MNEELIMKLIMDALLIILKITLPILVVGLVVGLLVGLFQATTQIQEMTLSFIPKIIITFLVILIMGQWMLTTLIEYTRELLSLISTLGQIK
ncbi:MAG: flagellar biosynthesis protein FliQ [Fusobacteriaceae bacterium]|jgi:flagellar biosynthesis protein FliQ|nr:flagellar biosynthesis protein FliQ [Fusobacteriaceae bacterium]MBP6466497.1 flagellar biosynthesis protein FliQ [Fusobacteriaceae bacterium]MBP9595324.1 flagellar biosynthesis protein FliQ [Fusobacteriaceae bacterium]MBU9916921.1 flagellar biosynthesis protein FliQ [Fusobacteriaceae bacterium]